MAKVINEKITIQERGWASHFIAARYCLFRRNTLLEYKDISIVVSSVGRMVIGNKFVEIGHNRHFETMVFFADDTKYKDADVSRGSIYTEYLEGVDVDQEILANDTHDKVVDLMMQKLINNEINRF